MLLKYYLNTTKNLLHLANLLKIYPNQIKIKLNPNRILRYKKSKILLKYYLNTTKNLLHLTNLLKINQNQIEIKLNQNSILR